MGYFSYRLERQELLLKQILGNIFRFKSFHGRLRKPWLWGNMWCTMVSGPLATSPKSKNLRHRYRVAGTLRYICSMFNLGKAMD